MVAIQIFLEFSSRSLGRWSNLTSICVNWVGEKPPTSNYRYRWIILPAVIYRDHRDYFHKPNKVTIHIPTKPTSMTCLSKKSSGNVLLAFCIIATGGFLLGNPRFSSDISAGVGNREDRKRPWWWNRYRRFRCLDVLIFLMFIKVIFFKEVLEVFFQNDLCM